IALQDDPEPERLGALCRQLFDSLNVPMVLDGVQLEVSCCVGVALHPQDAHSVEDLMDSADLALYEARREGAGTFRFFVPPLREAVVRRKKLVEELRSASEAGEFELFYQPLVELG